MSPAVLLYFICANIFGLALVKCTVLFLSTVFSRWGLVTDSCGLELGYHPLQSPLTLHVRFSRIELTDFVLDWLSTLIGPYCALRITRLTVRVLKLDVDVVQLLRGFIPSVSIEGPFIEATVQHSCHWSACSGLDYACLVKHARANFLSDILEEKPLTPEVSMFAVVIDSIIAQLCLEVDGSEIRVVDKEENFALGIVSSRFSLHPGHRSQETLFSVPRTIDAYQCTVYLNPTAAELPKAQNEVMMTCSHIHNVLEFPDIWSTLRQPGESPLGRGKRIKLAGHYYHCVLKIHEEQLCTFLNRFLKAIGLYEYYPFQAHCIAMSALLDRPDPTVAETVIYMTDYKLYLTETNKAERARLRSSLLSLKANLSLPCIMSLRRKVHNWKFDSDFYPIAADEGDYFDLDGGASDDIYRCHNVLKYSPDDDFEDHAMSNYLSEKMPMYDAALKAVREVLVEITAEGLIFSVFDGQVGLNLQGTPRGTHSDPHMWCQHYGGKHWGLLSGHTASASVLVLTGIDQWGVRCGASSTTHREPARKWVEIKGTLGQAVLEYMGASWDVQTPLQLLQCSANAINEYDSIAWSAHFDSQMKSYFSLQISECCIDGFNWKHWDELVAIILRGVKLEKKEATAGENFPIRLFEEERKKRDSIMRKDSHVMHSPLVPTPHSTDGLLLKGCQTELKFIALNLDILLNNPHENGPNTSFYENYSGCNSTYESRYPLVIASLSGKFLFDGNLEQESLNVDLKDFTLRSWVGRSYRDCEMSGFYTQSPGGGSSVGKHIFCMHQSHLEYSNRISKMPEDAAESSEAKQMVSSCWNGKIVQRINLRLEVEDYFNSLDAVIFDSQICRAIVMLQVQIHRKERTVVASSTRSNDCIFSDSPCAHTLKRTFRPFEDDFQDFEFFTIHSDTKDDCQIIIDLFLVSEQLSGKKTRQIVGTVSTALDVFASGAACLSQTLASSIGGSSPKNIDINYSTRMDGVRVVEYVLPVRKADGGKSLQFIRLFQELTHPVLKLRLKSLKCLVPMEDSLETSGLDDYAKSIHLKITVPNLLWKSAHESSLDEATVENAKYYEDQFYGASDNREINNLVRTSKSCLLQKSEGDIMLDDTILIPIINMNNDFSILVELIAEGEFYSYVVGSVTYPIRGNSSVLLFEDRAINLRDNNKLTVASLIGQLSWIDAAGSTDMPKNCFNPSLSKRGRSRRYIDKELSFFAGNVAFAASLSRFILLNNVISAFWNNNYPARGRLVDPTALDSQHPQASNETLMESPSSTFLRPQGDSRFSSAKDISYCGQLVPLFGEYTSDDIKDIVLGKHASLLLLIAGESSSYHSYQFWEHFTAQTGCTDKKFAEYMYKPEYPMSFLECVRSIQLRMVTGFKNYRFAEDAWRYIVTPTWLGLPKIGNFKTKSRAQYLPMGSPILEGYRIFTDDGVTIQSIDSGLSALPLSGIMTARADRTSSSSKAFEFEVSGPCSVMVCWDIRIIKLPMWLMNFGSVTGLYVETNNTRHVVYCRHITQSTVPGGCFPAKIVLGGCGVYSSHKADNYFVLLSRYTPAQNCAMIAAPDDTCNNVLSTTTLLPLLGRNMDDYRWMLSPHAPVGDSVLVDVRQRNQRPSVTAEGAGEESWISRFTCNVHIDDIEGSVLDDILFRTILAKKYHNIDHDLLGCKEQISIHIYQLNSDISLTTMSSTNFITERPTDLRCDAVCDLSIVGQVRPSRGAWSLMQRNLMTTTSMNLSLRKIKDSSRIVFNFCCPSTFAVEISPPVARIISNLISDVGTSRNYSLVEGNQVAKLVALDDQFEISLVPYCADIVKSNPEKTSVVDSVDFKNDLGVPIGVIVKSNLSVKAKTVNSQIILNPNALSSDALKPIVLKPGMVLTVSLVETGESKKDAKTFDLVGALKFGVVTEGWSCKENIAVFLSGYSLYRIDLDAEGINHDLKAVTERRKSQSGSLMSNQASSERAYSASSTIGGDISGGVLNGVDDIIDDSETWRSCSSEDEENSKVSLVKQKNTRSSSCQSDQSTPHANLPSYLSNDEHAKKQINTGTNSSKINSIKTLWNSKKRKRKLTLSPYAIEAEYVLSADTTLENGKPVRSVGITVRTNIHILSESLNPVKFLKDISNKITGNNYCGSPGISLTSLQRLNVPLDCLRSGRLFFRRMSPVESNTVDSNLALKPKRLKSLYKVAIRPQAFDMKVSSALRTSQEIENNSMRIRPRVGEEVLNADSQKEEILSRRATELSNSQGKLLEWEIVIYPMLKFVNALPCDLKVAVVQPPKPAFKRDHSIGQSEEGARDLFYLPTEFDRFQDVKELEGWKAFDAFSENDDLVCNVEIKSGSTLEVPNIDLKKTIYFRVLIPGTNLWSKSCAISSPVLNSKYMFSKHKAEDIPWSYTRDQDIASGSAIPPQIRFRREWANVRSVILFSEYWIVNKTAIQLHYDTKLLIPKKMKLGDMGKEAEFKEGIEVKHSHSAMAGRLVSLKGRMALLGKNMETRDLADGNMIVDEINTEVSDEAHIKFFGSARIPVMMSCPSRRLRIMTVGNLSELRHQHFYVYDLESGSPEVHRQKYRIIYGLSTSTVVYGDRSDVKFVSFPATISDRATETIYIQTLDVDKSAETKNINFLTFKLSKNGFVHVGVDLNGSHPLSWMEILGFRDTGTEIRSNHPRASVYRLYRKFYRAHSIVHLGGCHRSFHTNNPSKMYIVAVQPSPEGYFEPSVEDIYHYDPDLSLSWTHARSSNCRQLPKFGIGDSCFTDTKSKVTYWSPLFHSVDVLAIQTANRDKSSTSHDYLCFQLKQPSQIFLCIDKMMLSQDYPDWIGKNGYQRMPLTVKTEDSIFYVFSQSFGAELCFFGGINVPSESYICNFFILIVDRLQFVSRWAISCEGGENIIRCASKCKKSHEQLGVCLESGIAVSGISCPDFPLSPGSEDIHSIYRFWDREHSAAVAQQVPVSHFDRSWSRTIIDLKRGNAGEVIAGSCVLAAQVTFLPGIFNRTCLVTLLPRFIVLNETDIDLLLLPFESSMATGEYDIYNKDIDKILLNKGSKCSISSFFRLSKPEIPHKMKRWISFCDADLDSETQKGDIEESSLDVLIQPVCADDIGDQFSWIRVKLSNSSNDGKLFSYNIISVSVVLAGQTVALTVRDVSKSPPYRIENRLTNVSIQIRQKGCPDWITLPPRSWRSFIWCNYNAPKLLEVKVTESKEKPTTYSMDKIGRVAMFYWCIYLPPEGNNLSNYLSKNPDGMSDGYVQGYLFADGMTRVLSLCEVIGRRKGGISGENQSMAGFNFSGGLLSSHRDSAGGDVAHSMNRRKVGGRNENNDLLMKPSFFGKWVDLLQHLCASVSITGFAVKLVEIKGVDPTNTDGMGSSVRFDDSVNAICLDLLDVSFEHVHCAYNGPQYEMVVTFFHIQIDDMRKNSKFPIVLSPVNSGYNSHLNIDNTSPIPQVHVILECAPNLLKLVHVKNLEMAVQETGLRVDMEFVMQLVRFIGVLIQACEDTHLGAAHNSSREDIERMISQSSLSVVREQLQYTITKKVMSSTEIQYNNLIYVELLHLSTALFQLEIFVGKNLLHVETASFDKATALGYAGLGGETSAFLSGIIGTIGHVSPTLKFDEILVSKYFGTPGPLYQFLYTSYKRNALLQSYKIFGSMEVLGDPLSLVNNLGAGVVQLFSQTRAEVVGDSRTRGEGFRRLARAVVGGAAGSASKLTGSLADILGTISFHKDREHLGLNIVDPREQLEDPIKYSPANFFADEERRAGMPDRLNFEHTQKSPPSRSTVVTGLRQGGDVMLGTVCAGFTGLVEEPIRGMHDDGVVGAAKGVAKGLVKVVASPFVGVLGAVAVLAESVEMSTRYRNGVPVGRRHLGSANKGT